jgi:hypothetical protein
MKPYPNARIPLIHRTGSWISLTTPLPRISHTWQHLVLLPPVFPSLYKSSEAAVNRALTGPGHFCVRAIHRPFCLPVLLLGRDNRIRGTQLCKMNDRIDYHCSIWLALILSVYFLDFLKLDLGRNLLEMVHEVPITSHVNKKIWGNRSSLCVLKHMTFHTFHLELCDPFVFQLLSRTGLSQASFILPFSSLPTHPGPHLLE